MTPRDPIVIAVAAAFATIVTVPFVPPGIPIVIAAAVSGTIAVLHHRRPDVREAR